MTAKEIEKRTRRLTTRQQAVLRILLETLDTEEIAKRTGTRSTNVRQHLSKIYAAFDIEAKNNKNNGVMPLLRLLTTVEPIPEVKRALYGLGYDKPNIIS